MSDPIIIATVGIVAVFALIFLHVPIGVAMGLVGVVGFAMIVGWEPALSLLANEPASVITNLDLAVIPLFLLMGSLAGAGGLASDVYRLAYAFVGHRPGGLAYATIGGCAGFGSVCGSSVATAATFGRIALPEMLNRGYSPSLAAGTVAAGGTLGIIIPPSAIMVIYAILTEQFILDLFIAAVIPAILSTVLYLIAVQVYVGMNRDSAPAGERFSWRERLDALRANWGVLALATSVLGGIYSGVFSVSEAAAVGVTIAFAFAVGRRKLTWGEFLRVLAEASATSLMIYVMIIGASVFSYFMTITRAPEQLIQFITSLDATPLLILFALLAIYIVLGAIFDEVAAMVITLPFVIPLILHLGYDLVWWGIVNVVVIGVGMITPPIGINVLVIQSMRKEIPLMSVYKGIFPFLAADLFKLGLLTAFPPITLWLLHLSRG
jgi:C4-dicarboxylate transporter, DctM subunit